MAEQAQRNASNGGVPMSQGMLYAIASDDYNWETARANLASLIGSVAGTTTYGSFLSDLVAGISENGISGDFHLSSDEIQAGYFGISGTLLKGATVRPGDENSERLATQEIWRQVDADLHPSANPFWVDTEKQLAKWADPNQIIFDAAEFYAGGEIFEAGVGLYKLYQIGKVANLSRFWFGRMIQKEASALLSRLPSLPEQIHHFATNKSSAYTLKMLNIAEKFGLDLDEAWNKELLPHLGRHPNEYHDFVYEGMQKAAAEANGNKNIFLDLFEKYVKDPIKQNPELLRKAGWQ